MNSFAFGSEAKANQEAGIAFGTKSVSDALGGIALGNSAQALGTNSIAIGRQAIASKEYSVVIGAHTDKKGTGSNVTAVGQQTEVLGNHSTAVGMAAKANVERATAIGSYANALAAGSVALGAGSTASREAGVQGYDPLTGDKSAKTIFAWKSTKGAVSVGGVGVTRQIINVAAGTEDSDAVNVAQLKKVGELATAAKTEIKKGDNIAFVDAKTAKDGHTIYTINAKGTKVTGDANFIVDTVEEANNVTNYKLKLADTVNIGKVIAKDVEADTFKAGDTTVTNKGLEIKGGPSVTKDGINAGDKKITGVAEGVADTDAVNVGQLKNSAWNLATNGVVTGDLSEIKANDIVNFEGDENIGVSKETVNGINTVKVELNKDLKVNSVNAGDYFFDAERGVGFGSEAYITQSGLNANDKVITNVAAGVNNTDAVNVGQLNSAVANSGWKLATNGVLTKAKDVKSGEYVDFSGDQNISISSDEKDGVKTVKVELSKDLRDIESISNGDSRINLNADSISISNGNKSFAITNSGIGMSYIGADYSAKSIMLGENGTTISGGLNVAGSKITGVAAGVEKTDAVNVGQLNAAVEAGNTDTHIKPGEYGVGADNKVNMDVVDKTGKTIGKVTITDVAKASDVGDVSKIADDIKNGEGKTTVVDAVNNLNNKVGDLQYSKVEKGDIKDGDSTTTAIGKLDQKLTDVAATAAKHSKVVNGTNINVEESDVDGQKVYKVNLNNNIMVGDVTGKYVSISGTNGTIEATGAIATKDRVYADKGGKLADIDVTGNKISNGASSIVLDGSNVQVNDKVTIDQDGKISGVAAGVADTDAVNVGQLKDSETKINNRIDGVENQVINNTNRINKLGSRVNKVGAGAAALAALHPMDFDPDDKLTFAAGYGNYAGENAAAIGAYYRPDEKVMFSVAGTVGNGENMVNAGISFALDRTNHVSNSRTALAREVIDLRGQLAVMGAKMAKMEKAFGMLDETKTKLFPDVPANHWAYEYIAKLAGNGYIEGYPDGNFGGDRLMTRYEFAAMLYRAIENGAALEEKIIKEFEPELGRIRVDRISGEDGDRDKIERVRVNDTKGERDHYGNKLAK